MEQEIKRQLKELISSSSVYDEEKKYFDFSKIWSNPEKLICCSNLISSYIENEVFANLKISKKEQKKYILVSADNIGSSFGTIPIAFRISEIMGFQNAVWKEYSNITWGTPALFGNGNDNDTCIVLQDVVDEGTTAIKLAYDLKNNNWKFLLYIAIVYNPAVKGATIESTLSSIERILGEKPKFFYILDKNDFGE